MKVQIILFQYRDPFLHKALYMFILTHRVIGNINLHYSDNNGFVKVQ